MPLKASAGPTCFLMRFDKNTIFLPVVPTTTLPTLRTALLDALKHAQPLDGLPSTLPSAADLGIWKGKPIDGGDGGTKWERLSDEKTAVGGWGLKEAEEVGVSFKANGTFPEPHVVRPDNEVAGDQ